MAPLNRMRSDSRTQQHSALLRATALHDKLHSNQRNPVPQIQVQAPCSLLLWVPSSRVCSRRQAELTSLDAAEQQRSTAAAASAREHAAATLQALEGQAPAVRARLVHLARVLVSLLESCVMPGDLVPSPGAEVALRCGWLSPGS